MIGATAHATARFFFIYAEWDRVLYIGATVSSLGPIVAPVLRSMTSKIVPLAERGKVFALLSVFDNCVPLFSGVLYSQVYNRNIHTNPGSIFWLTMATQTAVFVFMGYIHFSLKGRSLAVDEYGDPTSPLDHESGKPLAAPPGNDVDVVDSVVVKQVK